MRNSKADEQMLYGVLAIFLLFFEKVKLSHLTHSKIVSQRHHKNSNGFLFQISLLL